MQRPTIFIIDDSPMITQFLTIFLEKNYTVYSYHNPLEALEDLKNGLYPDVIITDFDMPELNGLEFLKKTREAACYIPIIVVSGMKDSKYRLNCLEAGADDFVLKPFHPSELEIRIKKQLSQIEENKKSENPSFIRKMINKAAIF